MQFLEEQFKKRAFRNYVIGKGLLVSGMGLYITLGTIFYMAIAMLPRSAETFVSPEVVEGLRVLVALNTIDLVLSAFSSRRPVSVQAMYKILETLRANKIFNVARHKMRTGDQMKHLSLYLNLVRRTFIEVNQALKVAGLSTPYSALGISEDESKVLASCEAKLQQLPRLKKK